MAVEQDADGVAARPGCGPGTWSPPTGCTRRCAGRSGWGRRAARPARYGLRRHFAVAPWSAFVEVHWAAHAEAYVTPVGDGWSASPCSRPDRAVVRRPAGRLPRPAARLRGAEPATGVRGAGPLRQGLAHRVAGRVLLVGDAAGYVDALTGEGSRSGWRRRGPRWRLSLADRPEDYQPAWRRVTRRYRWSSSALLAVAGRPALRRRLVPAAAALPSVFGLAVDHVA